MGSDLYLSIDVHRPEWREPDAYSPLFEGPSEALERGIIVDAFDERDARDSAHGYLTSGEMIEHQKRRRCPWRDDEPYWVRWIDGQGFCDIIREKRWQTIQKAPDGTFDFHDLECSAELRAFAAAVKSLMDDGCKVRVWCWHSQ